MPFTPSREQTWGVRERRDTLARAARFGSAANACLIGCREKKGRRNGSDALATVAGPRMGAVSEQQKAGDSSFPWRSRRATIDQSTADDRARESPKGSMRESLPTAAAHRRMPVQARRPTRHLLST